MMRSSLLPALVLSVACQSPPSGSPVASTPSETESGSDHSKISAAVAPTPSTWQNPPSAELAALDRGRYISLHSLPGALPLVANGRPATLWVADQDTQGVRRAVADLQRDLSQVSGAKVPLSSASKLTAKNVVLVGTLGQSPIIDALVKDGKLNVSAIVGRWETHLITIVDKPFAGVDRAAIVVGSDPRGTIFGAYDVSRQIGVSPWYFWDDVPLPHHAELYLQPGRFSQGEPVVKYRGFFINDEEPQLGRWARATFGPAPNPKHAGTFNHKLYAHVYELMLRLKANYLWPAVWSRSLFDDDPRNQSLAAEYGIVMGTSHEAPMMRAQDEWNRYGAKDGPYGGNGAFSFARNQPTLEKYWADGLRRNKDYESLITVGMRGNGDTGMEDAAGTELMGRIVTAQRKIIADVTGKKPETVPQVWTLYKEVQDYWDAEMRAPDDVTIIWCDDNWGNMRGLPDQKMAKRAGGYGLYYHFDYVGGSRNYKWVDTTLLPNMWEQLHLSYRYGVDRVWMTNVGDLKNDEHPLSFFLDYAWDPERWPVERIHDWEKQWAAEQFGSAHAEEAAAVLEQYGNLQSRRKPELLNRITSLDPKFDVSKKEETRRAVVNRDGSPFHLVNYQEAERIVAEWQDLLAKSKAVRAKLAAAYDDAYYELVHYAVEASANVYALHLAQFNNLRYAAQGRAATASSAAKTARLFAADQEMSRYYNETLANGKWKDWQTQPKLAYGGPYPNSSWQQPEKNGGAVPDFVWPRTKEIKLPKAAHMVIAVDGSEELFSQKSKERGTLPEFSPFQSQPAQFLEVVNQGQAPFDFQIESSVPWLTASPAKGRVDEQVRVRLKVDWTRAPKDRSSATLTIRGASSSVTVLAPVFNPKLSKKGIHAFVEANGYVSIEAMHFHRSVTRDGIGWKLIPQLGRTAGGLTPFPVTAKRQAPGGKGVRLEYALHTFSKGEVKVWAYLSPRNNVRPTDGLKYGVSIDEEAPQIVDSIGALNGIPPNASWERNSADNTIRIATVHTLTEPGSHTLKFWMVDPTVVVQKLVVDTGGLKESYLGPPESFRGD